MPIATVIFAHGKESGPWGIKIRALAKIAERSGCRIISRDDRDVADPELRVDRLIEEAASLDGPLVLVGSSMGGYVATLASRAIRPVGLFLMAPAFGLPGYAEQAPQPSCRELDIVYGWADDIVPLAPVLEFARTQQAYFHLLPAGHALIEQLEWLTRIFEIFLDRCLQQESTTAKERLLATL